MKSRKRREFIRAQVSSFENSLHRRYIHILRDHKQKFACTFASNLRNFIQELYMHQLTKLTTAKNQSVYILVSSIYTHTSIVYVSVRVDTRTYVFVCTHIRIYAYINYAHKNVCTLSISLCICTLKTSKTIFPGLSFLQMHPIHLKRPCINRTDTIAQ